MKDFDFDELDKAVSSLVGETKDDSATAHDNNPQADAVVTSAPSPVTVPQRSSIAAGAVEVKSERTAVTPIVLSPRSASSPATRRSGRFMDVMHPSADMVGKKEENTQASYTGKTLKPLSANVKPEPLQQPGSSRGEQPSIGKQLEVPSAPNISTLSLPETAEHDTEWPDPLDNFNPEQASDADLNQPASTDSEPIATSDTDTLVASSMPESPFLADAKVSKRPLGAFTDEVAATPEDSLAAAPNSTQDLQKTPTILPPELSHDLISIEGGDEIHHSRKPSEDLPARLSDVTPTKPSPVTTEQKSAAASSSASSIPQQYNAGQTPRAANVQSSLETEHYHQPLTTPVKKGKAGLVKLLIGFTALIIIGAGLGAAAYYLIGF